MRSWVRIIRLSFQGASSRRMKSGSSAFSQATVCSSRWLSTQALSWTTLIWPGELAGARGPVERMSSGAIKAPDARTPTPAITDTTTRNPPRNACPAASAASEPSSQTGAKWAGTSQMRLDRPHCALIPAAAQAAANRNTGGAVSAMRTTRMIRMATRLSWVRA